MKRRCELLDSLSALNYNTGGGEYLVTEQKLENKLEQNVALPVQKDAQLDREKNVVVTDTRQLGSTLMRTMLQEVSDFCDPLIKENWFKKPHQQVITSSKV